MFSVPILMRIINRNGCSVQLLSRVQFFVIPWTAARQASLSITNSQRLLKLTSIELVMTSNYLILCGPLLLPLIFPGIRVFSNESVLRIKRPKYWSFSFNINPTKEYSGLISFRMDWLDFLAVQGTLKSLLKHHSSKASILQCSEMDVKFYQKFFLHHWDDNFYSYICQYDVSHWLICRYWNILISLE